MIGKREKKKEDVGVHKEVTAVEADTWIKTRKRQVHDVIDISATRQCAVYELQSTPSLLFLWLRCANMQHDEPSTSVTLTHPQKETHNQGKGKKQCNRSVSYRLVAIDRDAAAPRRRQGKERYAWQPELAARRL